jgi:hypothetical protein
LLPARVSAQGQGLALPPEAECARADAELVSAPAQERASEVRDDSPQALPVRAWLRDAPAARELAHGSAEPELEAASRAAAGPVDSPAALARAGPVSLRAARALPPVEQVWARSRRVALQAEGLRAALPVLPGALLLPRDAPEWPDAEPSLRF